VSVSVSCVGVATLDLIYGVDHLPAEDGKMPARSYRESGGGMAANAAVIVARLGGQSTWCGRLGADDLGDRILDGLRREGVDVSPARTYPGTSSPHSIVLSDRKGNRAIILYRPPAIDPDPTWLPLEKLLRADAVLADNRWIEGASRVLAAGRALGRPAILDADAAADSQTVEAVRAASHAIFSAPGLAGLYGTDDPEEGLRLASRDCRFVAVTRGPRGVMWIGPDGALRVQPAFTVEAVETVGAGDIFHGAFALRLVETGVESDSLRFAAAAAALKCAGTGGRASFPDRAAVDALLTG
jgi:sulfofructose kinase